MIAGDVGVLVCVGEGRALTAKDAKRTAKLAKNLGAYKSCRFSVLLASFAVSFAPFAVKDF
jgi:hypothetical protein